MITLGVNIDHVATIRQARMTWEPDPVEAAFIAEKNGASCITVHLREDRRHIQDRDVEILRKTVTTKLNLEMGASDEIIDIALSIKPDQVTLVPEKREEVTTEGGLDVFGSLDKMKSVVSCFNDNGIKVSLFVDPDEQQIQASAETGAEFIEIHTGCYANCWPDENKLNAELMVISKAAALASDLKLRVNGGHGLTYHNVGPIAAVPQMEELNIGHSIISRAVMVGLGSAVCEMKNAMLRGRTGQ